MDITHSLYVDHLDIAQLPTRSTPKTTINPIARILLAGAILPNSSLFHLLNPDLINIIFSHLRRIWQRTLIRGYDNVHTGPHGNAPPFSKIEPPPGHLAKIALARVARMSRIPGKTVSFPAPKGLHCNMLPFISHLDHTIPPEYHAYFPVIDMVRFLAGVGEHEGEVWYLTIHEGEVSENAAEEASPIHTEGMMVSRACCTEVMRWHKWGCGRGAFSGGMYQVSSISDSSRMWNVQIPWYTTSILGNGSNLDYLRGVLDEAAEAVVPRANEMYWMTDFTPHQALPLKQGANRQYFRLVTGKISGWWKEHSTANRYGVQPDCQIFEDCKVKDGALSDYDACAYQRSTV